MANVDRPNGFRVAKSLIGAPWTSLIRFYEAADRSADTTNNHGDIYIGDPVALSSGKVVPANSGDTILGVAVAVGKDGSFVTDTPTGYYNPDDLTQRYGALTDATGVVVGVIPAEAAIFEVQSDSDLDLAIGANADITNAAATAHGSQTTGKSTCEITTAVNNDVKVVEFVTTPDNDTTLANARYLVKFNTTTNTI